MNRATVRPRSRGRAWYQGEKWCPAELDFAIRELQARCERLECDPVEELHNSCGAKVEHLKHLSAFLELDDEVREAARNMLAETEQWLDEMPVGRQSRLIARDLCEGSWRGDCAGTNLRYLAKVNLVVSRGRR